jgi:hypothetical protein
MMQPIDYQTPEGPIGFRSRKTMLLVMGIILIAMGAISGCMGIVAPIGIIVSQKANPAVQHNVRDMAAGLGILVLVSIALIWGGIGSIRCRRWIRPLVLILGTLGLVVGVGTMGVMIIAIPQMLQAIQTPPTPGAPAMPAAARGFFVAFTLLTVLVLYVGIPAVFVWFYRPDDVRKTLEYYDPRPRWTDQRPLPLLGISVVCALASLSCLLALINYRAMPLFGFIVTGAAGMAVILVSLVAFAFAAVLTYRRQIAGWWLAIAIVGLFTLSTIVTALRLDPNRLVEAMGMNPQEAKMYRDNPMSEPIVMGIVGVVVSLVTIGYLLWARKFFQPHASDSVTASTQ